MTDEDIDTSDWMPMDLPAVTTIASIFYVDADGSLHHVTTSDPRFPHLLAIMQQSMNPQKEES